MNKRAVQEVCRNVVKIIADNVDVHVTCLFAKIADVRGGEPFVANILDGQYDEMRSTFL